MKKELKVKTKTVHTLEYREWDSFINENYPDCPYHGIVAEEEMSNDSTYSHTTSEMNQEKRIKISKYLEGNFEEKYIYGSTGDILDLLVAYEVIPKGLYNINICW